LDLDPTLIELINAGTVGATGLNPTAVTFEPSLDGGAASATTMAVDGDTYALSSTALDLTPSVTGGVGGQGTDGDLMGFEPRGVISFQGTIEILSFPSAPGGYAGGLGGLGGDAELDLTDDQFGSAASPLGANVTIDDHVTGGAGGSGGYGGGGGGINNSSVTSSGGLIQSEVSPGSAGDGGAGGNGGNGGSAVNATTELTEVTNAQAYIGMTATGGKGVIDNGGVESAGGGGEGSPPGDGGNGANGGTGGAATASLTNSSVTSAVSITVALQAEGGAGGYGGWGGTPGYSVYDVVADGEQTYYNKTLGVFPGFAGDGGTSGSATAILTGDTLAAPQVTLSLTATPGMPGYDGIDGDAAYAYDQTDTYYIGDPNPPPIPPVGPLAGSGTGQITVTGNTVTVSQELSLTLHVESDLTGTPTLVALNGGAGGNLTFSGNSFIGDGASELDLQGSGSNALVNDQTDTLSIAGSPANGMTGFDIFVLGDGDTFTAGIEAYTKIYVAPDPDTIVLTPGHGAIDLNGVTDSNTILDFQGYPALSLVALQGDTFQDGAGNTWIDIPGDSPVELTSATFTPTASDTNLPATGAPAPIQDVFSGILSEDWSNAGNWSGGLPTSGDSVIGGGTDDIGSLVLSSLTLTTSQTVEQATLTATGLILGATAALDVGSAATVTITGAVFGASATLSADGPGAVLDDEATTDPGETYEVVAGGKIIMAAPPAAGSELEYDPSGTTSGTFALSNPGTVVTALVANILPGDTLELPGSTIESASFGYNQGTFSVTTDADTYTFTNVQFGLPINGYTSADDTTTGLVALTFTGPNDFNDTDSPSSGPTAGDYFWSDALNWSSGLPHSGGDAFVLATGTDDIATLTLHSLGIAQYNVLTVNGQLTVSTLSLGAGAELLVNPGAAFTLQGTLNGEPGGYLYARGGVLTDNATTDPGETYQVTDGGKIILTATPSASSVLAYDPAGSSGTIALADPGSAIAAALNYVGVGDTLELPGIEVESLTANEINNTLSVTTDDGTYTFSSVTYNTPITGYTAATDPTTGLEAITFTGPDTFTGLDAPASGPDAGDYLFSDTLNWTSGIPATGTDIYVLNSGTADIASLVLSSVTLANYVQLDVADDLSVSDISLGYGSDILVNNGATFTVQNTLASAPYGFVDVVGPATVFNDGATTDAGLTYTVTNGGEIILTATPSAASTLNYDQIGTSGTIALVNPGATTAAALNYVGVGDVLELPGTSVVSVTPNTTNDTLSIITSNGTYLFSSVDFDTPITGYTAAIDTITGLEAITFTGPDTFISNDQATSGPYSGNYTWSDSLNWTSGIPVSGSSPYLLGGGVDNIANLFLNTLTLSQYNGQTVSADLTVTSLSLGQYAYLDVTAGATLTIQDTIASVGPGNLEATGTGAVIVNNAATDPGETYQAEQGGTVILAAKPAVTSGLSYDQFGSSGTFALEDPGATIAAQVTNVGAGDVLELPGLRIKSVSATTSSLDVTTNIGTYDFTDVSFLSSAAGYTQAVDPGTGLVALTFTTASDPAATPLCFLRGTLIRIPSGETPIELLAEGDLIVTERGEARRIAWIGIGKVLATRGRRSAATPVIVRKSALSDNVPHHDLRLTKGHALHFDGVLIPVEFLVNHRSILWDDRAQEVLLYHIELESHDVLLANGAAAESYRDDGNRWLFQNANSGADLPPLPPCAPVLTGGPVVDAVWRRLLDRAGPRPGLPTTAEPDLHLLVDGARVESEPRPHGVHLFRLLQRPTEIRVVSRACAPDELGIARDPRLLGVAVRQIRLWRDARLRLVEASDPSLDDGFHLFEADNGFRWTDGNALLPAALFDGVHGACDLELHIGGTTRYSLFGEPVRAAAA
jgi:hypothetical protein